MWDTPICSVNVTNAKTNVQVRLCQCRASTTSVRSPQHSTMCNTTKPRLNKCTFGVCVPSLHVLHFAVWKWQAHTTKCVMTYCLFVVSLATSSWHWHWHDGTRTQWRGMLPAAFACETRWVRLFQTCFNTPQRFETASLTVVCWNKALLIWATHRGWWVGFVWMRTLSCWAFLGLWRTCCRRHRLMWSPPPTCWNKLGPIKREAHASTRLRGFIAKTVSVTLSTINRKLSRVCTIQMQLSIFGCACCWPWKQSGVQFTHGASLFLLMKKGAETDS